MTEKYRIGSGSTRIVTPTTRLRVMGIWLRVASGTRRRRATMSALERYQPPQRLDEIERLADHFTKSGLFGNTPKTQGEIIVKMLAGAENGFPPFASVQGIHVIQGKPEMGADLLARAVKQSGRYDYRV